MNTEIPAEFGINIFDSATEAADMIRETVSVSGTIGIVLGTGLGGLVSEMNVTGEIPYDDIPHFPVSTVESHHGRLLFGTINDVDVIVLQGRFHVYEGYPLQQITFPIRVLKLLGVKSLVLSNACGGMHPLYRRGDVMIMDDHINLLCDNPLIGFNDDRFGPRFPDMSEPYSKRLIGYAREAALDMGQHVHQGVYVAVQGPNLETRAEYRFLRTIGADVVGMSTVPENIVARHMGMEVLGLSIVTDECFPDSLHPVSIEDVLAAAGLAEPVMTGIITRVLPRL